MDSDTEKHIHIISFDIPYPADYGGVIDVYYKVKALSEQGFKVHLHCFEYGRKQTDQLKKITFSVNYYARKRRILHLFSSIPFIVSSRTSKKLEEELSKDDYPILYEGLHTTAILNANLFKNRKQIVRMHNIEHDYYHHLNKASSSILKKWFYKTESLKLVKYEKVLQKADQIWAISLSDYDSLKSRYAHVIHVSAFHSNDEISSQKGMGRYALYHGNLSVEENEKAALYLVRKIFSKSEYPCIIAGKNPSAKLQSLVDRFKNIELVANPDKHTMKELVKEAHVNVLPTFQATGIKLKLLESIALGRFCLVNSEMVENTGLENLVICKNNSAAMLEELKRLQDVEFTKNDISKREEIWKQNFSNQSIIEKTIKAFD